ncbi:15484_t:CDS:10 [Acaulospora colombiana]|uniref:15484_t:CDS:1 n=1 Tax=Acaulospora colombiana TaxID=27376 RepID=A0ACA9LAK8_9GLOM|nr:15484_t:CDS:10 [Acaulospora colombiana]
MTAAPSEAQPWERILWKRLPFPDNYVSKPHFLASLRKNVLASTSVSQHVASIFIFLAIFIRLKENSADPRIIIWLSILLFFVGWISWEITLFMQNTPLRRELLALAPVLKTLTEATSSDSIWALSFSLFILHTLLADYTTPLVREGRERLTSVLSMNAAISASVVLASRLNTDFSVFALMLFSVQDFALFPLLRRQLHVSTPDMRYEESGTLLCLKSDNYVVFIAVLSISADHKVPWETPMKYCLAAGRLSSDDANSSSVCLGLTMLKPTITGGLEAGLEHQTKRQVARGGRALLQSDWASLEVEQLLNLCPDSMDILDLMYRHGGKPNTLSLTLLHSGPTLSGHTRPKAELPPVREGSLKGTAAGISCLLQVVQAQAFDRKHVICIAPTGAGKTLPLLLPTFIVPKSITLVVSPLNLLTKQINDLLTSKRIKSVALTAETSNLELIEVICLSPEQLVGTSFKKVLESKEFESRLSRIVIDEVHILKQWGSRFRSAYLKLDHLRYTFPKALFYLTTATLTPNEASDLRKTLKLPDEDLLVVKLSNDRPKLKFIVKQIKGKLSLYEDLVFLLGESASTGCPPPKFLVFTNTRKEAQDATIALQKHLPAHLRRHLTWLHAGSSDPHKASFAERLQSGYLWGGCVTDVAAMGIDVSDIVYVVQWRMSAHTSTTLQRLGRAGRSDMNSYGIVFVEPDFFLNRSKRPATQHDQRPTKRRKTQNTTAQATSIETQDVNKSTDGSHAPPQEIARKINGEDVDKSLLEFVRTKGCRRHVLNEHYKNAEASKWKFISSPHLTVSIAYNEQHCARCSTPQVGDDCQACDNCQPELLDLVKFVDPVQETARSARVQKPVPFEGTPTELELQQKLVTWREEVYQRDFGGPLFTGEMILSDKEVSDLVCFARMGVIRSARDITDRLGTQPAYRYTEEMIKIIEAFNTPAVNTVPVASSSLVACGEPKKSARAQPKCGDTVLCPKYDADKAQMKKAASAEKRKATIQMRKLTKIGNENKTSDLERSTSSTRLPQVFGTQNDGPL